jgi:hypothetical protein
VTRRCEYGNEILVVLAYLVYVIGLSLEKACAVLRFFCHLPLSRSQADALLRQLAQHWEGEFDTLCDLLVDAAVVYTDETAWKIGVQGSSLWTFASEHLRLFHFGVPKDGPTLEAILPSDRFSGILVSDNAAVYRDRYARSQKCWAHLLRKAIRLAVPQAPLSPVLGSSPAVVSGCQAGRRGWAVRGTGAPAARRRLGGTVGTAMPAVPAGPGVRSQAGGAGVREPGERVGRSFTWFSYSSFSIIAASCAANIPNASTKALPSS